MGRPVQVVLNAITGRSRHGDVHTGVHVVCRRRSSLHRKSGSRDQISRLATVERQLQNALVLDNGSDANAACFNLRSIGLHIDPFRHRTNPKCYMGAAAGSLLT